MKNVHYQSMSIFSEIFEISFSLEQWSTIVTGEIGRRPWQSLSITI